MVGVGDETCDGPEEGEGFDFEVRRVVENLIFVEGDVGIVFFVDVEVFDEPFMKEGVESQLLFP